MAVHAMWAFASSFDAMITPATLDYILRLWAKTNPFSTMVPVLESLITATGKVTNTNRFSVYVLLFVYKRDILTTLSSGIHWSFIYQ